MEGRSGRIDLKNQEVGNPKVIEVSKQEYSQQEEPSGDYSEQEYQDEELMEDYPGEDYPDEEYPEGYEEDEDWEGEVGGSEPSPLGGLYGLFKDVSHQPDTKRVSNLTKEELGIWNLSVRDCERIALIAETFHHDGVAKFFRKQSRIVTDTAMSKGGWFTELFITSKKFASRDSSSSIQNLPQNNIGQKSRCLNTYHHS